VTSIAYKWYCRPNQFSQISSAFIILFGKDALEIMKQVDTALKSLVRSKSLSKMSHLFRLQVLLEGDAAQR
jgi:hypothetical protein